MRKALGDNWCNSCKTVSEADPSVCPHIVQSVAMAKLGQGMQACCVMKEAEEVSCTILYMLKVCRVSHCAESPSGSLCICIVFISGHCHFGMHRSYHPENTPSRPIRKIKLDWA